MDVGAFDVVQVDEWVIGNWFVGENGLIKNVNTFVGCDVLCEYVVVAAQGARVLDVCAQGICFLGCGDVFDMVIGGFMI